MSNTNIVYYNGVRVFPDYVSNIDSNIDKNNISVKSLYKCKCGSIFYNRESTKASHKATAKHQRYFKDNLNLSNEKMFELYRV
jgi:hypothetical protein